MALQNGCVRWWWKLVPNFIFIFIVFGALCENDNLKSARKLENFSYNAIWNIPTFQCRSHKINFTTLALKYGILQNREDDFRGDVISILYDPGNFPAILTGDEYGKEVLRNGGVPQQGNLTLHLDFFKQTVNDLIPKKDFSGIGVIDFESWRPVFRQNFGSLLPYKELSIEIEKQNHPFWPIYFIEKEAQKRFELYGRMFMEETLILAQLLRPNATWGYYAYPYCYNLSPSNLNTACPNDVKKENEKIEWLFNASQNFHPSLYLRQQSLTPKQRQQLITGRIEESHRLVEHLSKPKNPSIIPYFWYKYQDTNKFLTKDDVYASISNLRKLNIDALILWGSSNDVNTKSKCEELYYYIDTILGPALSDLRYDYHVVKSTK